MSDYIVEMKNITKRFPGIVANDDVTIQIKEGEIFAILGENGAGKSTLMSMLFGMYEPDEGEIFIRGKKESISSPKYATELNIGMVHQHFKLVENYTVTENIIMGIEPVKKIFNLFPKVDLETANKKVLELSKKHGLEVKPEKKIEELNVSIQQRVEILKMLYRKAEILIFDEPTAVLTPQEIDYFLEIIKGLRDEGKTIILITHKLEEIKKVTDRCAVLRRGQLIKVVETAETSTKEMSKLMVGRDVSLRMSKKEHNFVDNILDVKNITIENEDGFKIVNDVSFSIRSGEIFAIAGVSGNGQVEIGDGITGLIPIKSGQIKLNNQDITEMTIRQRTLLGVSYIPEDRHSVGLVLDYSLEDNLMLKNYFQEPYCHKGLLNRLAFKKKSQKLMESYDIRSGQGLKTVVRSMSGGNQQKAIIAREIEQGNPLIIFVQPTRGLDVGAIENIHKQILKERDKGKAILLISLELEEVMNLADTIGVIYNGQIQTIRPTKDLTSSEVGEYMMGVKKN